MKVGIITSIKAPYRTLQLEKICKYKDNIDLTVYYTNKGKEDRNWETKNSIIFKEVYLDNIKLFDKLGTLNRALYKIVKENEIIILGGYEKPTYILLSLLCKLYNKKYCIIFDGISCNRLVEKENRLKWLVKNLVIKNSSAIWGNGTVSKRYFNEIFNYPIEKIYNQYLTVDGEQIKEIAKDKDIIRLKLREQYGIDINEKVLHYSGRLADVKNIISVIKAISKINYNNITLFITGGGIQEKEIKKIANELNIKIIITGFINNQKELFKHYFLADAFILPSIYEPWGLVVNEAMYAGMLIIVSNICGCSLDLVKDDKNGYLINPESIEDIKNKIEKVFADKVQMRKMGEISELIIKDFSFYNSAKSFYKMIEERM